jgi:hypothetical protein
LQQTFPAMKFIQLLFFILLSFFTNAQSILKPGFDAKEYAELLTLTYFSSGIPDTAERAHAKDPYHREYRSEEIGLKNRWTFYIRNDNVGVIELRGTVNNMASWMANFYAAMIPATGSLQVNDSTVFNYQLAENPNAMIHVGWTVSLAHLAPEIIQKINSYYQSKKIKEFLIIGHSQGGALSFLLRSYLEYEQKKGTIPRDIFFKTYSSAAPKPGNMYYAYDYDFITRGGWGFNVVNAADWVPETPFSVQQITDFNPTNPLIHSKDVLKKQKMMIRFAGGIIYDKLERKPRKAAKKFRKYLGHAVYKRSIKKLLPQLKEPVYTTGNNYMRAGTPVILMTDGDYFAHYPESETAFFVHHSYWAYYYLLKKWYSVK